MATKVASELDVPPVTVVDGAGDPIDVLAQNWRRDPLLLRGTWMDISDVDLSLDGVGELLKSLPAGRISVREVGDRPGAPHVEGALTDAPLSKQLLERRLHITALDLAEVSPVFAALVERFLARLRPILAETDMDRLETSIGVFIASASSVVPFHVDFEHNFLFQLIGEKNFYIYPRLDPEILDQPALEQLADDMGKSRLLPHRPQYDSRAKVMRLEPGVATYQPPLAPHWVASAGMPTMSIVIGLFTSDELAERLTYLANHKLRRLGFRPGPVGRHPRIDRAKLSVMSAVRDGMRALRPVREVRGRKVDLRPRRQRTPGDGRA